MSRVIVVLQRLQFGRFFFSIKYEWVTAVTNMESAHIHILKQIAHLTSNKCQGLTVDQGLESVTGKLVIQWWDDLIQRLDH